MYRTFLFPLFPFVFFGCAPAGGLGQDTFLGVEADAKDEDQPAVGPLLPVRYLGDEPSVLIQITAPLPDGRDRVVAWGEVVEGAALIALPPARMNPNDPEAVPEYRVVARRMLEDGRAETILDVAPERLIVVPGVDGGMPRWQLSIPQPDDKPLLAPLRRGAEAADRLLPVTRIVVRGNVSGDLGAGRFALAALTDADATLSAYITPMMTTDGERFSVALEGPPPPATLEGADGPTSGRFWPVAWSDADGTAGFDPATDALLGLACTNVGVYTFLWQPLPRSTSDAATIADADLPVGWSAHLEGRDGLQPVSGGFAPWLSGDCL